MVSSEGTQVKAKMLPESIVSKEFSSKVQGPLDSPFPHLTIVGFILLQMQGRPPQMQEFTSAMTVSCPENTSQLFSLVLVLNCFVSFFLDIFRVLYGFQKYGLFRAEPCSSCIRYTPCRHEFLHLPLFTRRRDRECHWHLRIAGQQPPGTCLSLHPQICATFPTILGGHRGI